MKKKKRNTKFIYTPILFIIAFFLYSSLLLYENYQEYLKKEIEITEQLEDEQMRTEKIDAYESYLNSNKFVEDIARDKLGMVYEDEIIFKIKD